MGRARKPGICSLDLAAVVVLRGGIAPEAKQIPSPWLSRNESASKVAFDPSRLKNFINRTES